MSDPGHAYRLALNRRARVDRPRFRARGTRRRAPLETAASSDTLVVVSRARVCGTHGAGAPLVSPREGAFLSRRRNVARSGSSSCVLPRARGITALSGGRTLRSRAEMRGRLAAVVRLRLSSVARALVRPACGARAAAASAASARTRRRRRRAPARRASPGAWGCGTSSRCRRRTGRGRARGGDDVLRAHARRMLRGGELIVRLRRQRIGAVGVGDEVLRLGERVPAGAEISLPSGDTTAFATQIFCARSRPRSTGSPSSSSRGRVDAAPRDPPARAEAGSRRECRRRRRRAGHRRRARRRRGRSPSSAGKGNPALSLRAARRARPR